MPELPEVETIRRELAPLLTGRTILGVKVGRQDIIGYPEPRLFTRAIKGMKIVALERRGKYLILRLRGSGRTSPLLIIHLRLSGQLIVTRSRTENPRFERIRFLLSGGRSLVFAEPRVLGRAYLVDENNLPDALKGLREMGMEPIHPDFDVRYLKSKVGHRTASIKSLLLDQSITAGVGNIYSDEALFRAGIRPSRPARRISLDELRKLTQTLRDVLHDGISHMGTTMADSRYRRPDNRLGEFQKMLMVFDREGEPCRACGTIIRSHRIGNRTTRFCPRCQK